MSALARLRLVELTRKYEQTAEFREASGSVRHKCFVSYHAADEDEVVQFVETFENIFIPKAIGISDDEPWIDSENTDYIMDKVREKYLRDSTVTIVLVGKCTWARKFVDWEVYSSLRRSNNRLNGLLAIQLPSAAAGGQTGRLPDRVSDNIERDGLNKDLGYARYYTYPASGASLRSWIQDAFDARTARSAKIKNTRARRKANSSC